MAVGKKVGKQRAAVRRVAPDAERVSALRRALAQAIPRPQCELDHANPWQLLVATILSAQSTDKMVNKVTPELFRVYPSPEALAEAPRAEVERLVKSTGFFRNKAKAIQEASRLIAERHGGRVPEDLDALIELPGVARKTANVVLGTACGIASGIVVDTHAARVSQRLELTAETDAAKIERDLCALVPKSAWVDTGHRLVLHGRYVCLARAPRCESCPLNELCPSREAEPRDSRASRARAEARLVESRGQEDNA
jgi:endonuclease-3